MSEQYHIRVRGRVTGPYTPQRLVDLAKRGQFSRAHEVSGDNGRSWQRAGEFPEFFPAPATQRLRRTVIPLDDHEGIEMAEAEAVDAAGNGSAIAVQTASSIPAPAADLRQWYFVKNGQEVGPVGTDQLRQLVGIGELSARDYVWTEGLSEWVTAVRVPELFPAETPKSPVVVIDTSGSKQHASAGSAPMAVASFVLGLLGVTVIPFIGSILAVTFGHVALRQIARSHGALEGRGMAIAGLILGYIVIISAVTFCLIIFCLTILGIGFGFAAASAGS